MSNDIPQREDRPDKLWEIIGNKDAIIAKLRKQIGAEHWYIGYVGGDGALNRTYGCYCGYTSEVKEAIMGHLQWKLAIETNQITNSTKDGS